MAEKSEPRGKSSELLAHSLVTLYVAEETEIVRCREVCAVWWEDGEIEVFIRQRGSLVGVSSVGPGYVNRDVGVQVWSVDEKSEPLGDSGWHDMYGLGL